jgi:hypothetical protein
LSAATGRFGSTFTTGRGAAARSSSKIDPGEFDRQQKRLDALLANTTQQEIARTLFSYSVTPRRWRLESTSYLLRVQRLVRIARRRLADPWQARGSIDGAIGTRAIAPAISARD